MAARTVFVNNVDSYVGQALVAELQDYKDGSNTSVIGTCLGGDHMVPPGINSLVGRTDVKELIQAARSASLVVYDLHDADLEEVEMMLKAFKLLEKVEHKTTFVLISSAMTWKRTRRTREDIPMGEDEEEPEVPEGEEPPPRPTRPMNLFDKDYSRRIPSPKFEHWKQLETLTLALNSKDNLSAYVVCSGMLYGNGEKLFHDMFKAAWLSKQEHRIIGEGNNYLPLVHVRDLATCVKTLDVKGHSSQFVVCVDEGNLTQSEIVQGIVNHICEPYEVPMITPAEALLAELADVLTVDVRMEASAFMKVQESEEEEEEEGAVKDQFNWHCKDGLVANLSKVAAEFCKWRELRPIRIQVSGAPATGKSTVAAMLAERYNVPVVHIKDVVDKYLSEENMPAEETEEREAWDAAVAAMADAEKKVTGSKTAERAHLSNDIVLPLVKKALHTNVCKYRGFVLDGFPKNHDHAHGLFTKIEAGEDDEEPDENAPRVTDHSVAPEFFITLAADVEVCKERLLALAEEELAENGGEPRFNRRCDRFKQENQTPGKNGLAEFYESFCAATPRFTHTATEEDDAEAVFGACKKMIEEHGRAYNYLKTEEELAAPGLAAQAEREAAEAAAAAADKGEAIHEEEDKREVQDDVEETRRRLLEKAETQLLEAQSVNMREYLQKHVVPVLSDGLIEVCKVCPDDPVDHLAAYLFAHAGDIEATLEAPAKQD